mmetsp:Transcript_33752/g.61158  ORF Transcript_33752/g.61158 Transcript_33752/m.61158 type:complete len:888 (+) Transcript_33752:52-2715(+)|eukprot:CAMPEP_0197655458 /NCGR_PEP_ID=MMETSP1338-20131121/39461_1 /TAXON_ID=43686 ORGANISM="Pelagodinium beii, Strain RCC1491" /NCGR_SAMPLE_ID=MMETSP1338 /ASSEMBLY_ACC=CAM_ASM_000754 /LENGTH=887 /DNA_ID=CAMNT_0043231107 /DNA_START=51 /DNA_END=2714 /DNA_ORIENTATION=+
MGNSQAAAERHESEELPALKILEFCDWKQRARASEVSHSCRTSMGFQRDALQGAASHGSSGGEGYWRFLCDRLAEEQEVYVPLPEGEAIRRPSKGVAQDWQELFKELYSLYCRDVRRAEAAARAQAGDETVDEEPEDEEEAFKIGVAARFRPASSTIAQADEDRVVLPLHQKVQLVRQQLGCSHKEALALIMRKHQRRLHGGKMPAQAGEGELFLPCQARSGTEDKENIPETSTSTAEKEKAGYSGEKVIEEDAGAEDAVADARCSILSVVEEKASVLAITKQSGLREFGFDRVFSERSHQDEVYELTARRLVMEFLNGQSASIICYGQTGSGKTHTMFGSSPNVNVLSAGESERQSLRGLVPRTCSEVLNAAQAWKQRGLEVGISASYVELFGSEVSDLLREGRVVGQGREGRYDAVRATDRVGHRYVLDGHTSCSIESIEEVDELLRLGDIAKRRAATAMNERSTRAHTVFVLALSVHRRAAEGGMQLPPRKSRFYFADLGGSEQLSKSKVDAETKAPVLMVGGEEQSRISWAEFYHHRQRVQETLNINKGLFSLKRVIEALHRRSRMAAEGVPSHQLPYVPYQDSKLTMLLQEALGGDARTLVVTTATMDPTHAEESLQTLRFGETCAEVQKRREADQAASIHVALDKIDQEMKILQAEIVKKERWETRLVKRQDVDTVAGAFGEGPTVVRHEVMPTSVLVGAEAEREQLEKLLQRQAELQGLYSVQEFGKDYRTIQAAATAGAADGGRGADFRAHQFSAKTKAKEFEDEAVLADALRFIFRKASKAGAVFGEQSVKKRLDRDEMPEGYFAAARAMLQVWEEQSADGKESRSFGKAMLDRCTAWRSALKADPTSRDSLLEELLKECGIEVPTASSSHDAHADEF